MPTSSSRVRAEGAEVDAVTRVQVHGRQHVGQLSLALGPEPGDGLRLGHAGRQLLADDALVEDVRRVAQDLGADDGEGHADDGEQQHDDDARALGPEHAHDALERAAEVLGLLGRPGERWPAGPPPPGPRCLGARRRRLVAARSLACAAAAEGCSCHSLRAELRVHDLAVGLAASPAARRACPCRRWCRPRAR